MVSKSHIDRLGDRLKAGAYSDDDLRELDAYRQTFVDAYTLVVGRIRGELGLESTGRPAKSTTAIVAKLRRETIRLSQMQDIAGCRIVVSTSRAQTEMVQRLPSIFPMAEFVDRRLIPSFGYRAVHVIVSHDNALVEIQVRTRRQHQWAELSEKLSDAIGVELKYGGGDPQLQKELRWLSDAIALQESDSPDQPADAQIDSSIETLIAPYINRLS